MKKNEYIVCRDLLLRLERLLPRNIELCLTEDRARMIERLCPSDEIKTSVKRSDGSSHEITGTTFAGMTYDGHTYKASLSVAGAYMLMMDLWFFTRGCYKFTKLPEPPANSFFDFHERCKERKG